MMIKKRQDERRGKSKSAAGLETLKIIKFLIGLIVILTPLYGSQTPQSIEIISLVRTPSVDKVLASGEYDRLMERDGRIFLTAGPKELDKISRLGLSFRVETPFFQSAIPPQKTGLQIQGGVNGDFHTYLELERDLKALEMNYPQLAKLHAAGTSLENRKIYALKISGSVSSSEKKPAVMFLGCHHAREWISVEVPFLFADHLLRNYASDARIRALVDRSEIWIVPLVNPDGLEYTLRFYRYWRKNRRFNYDGSYGVDINRNYGWNWGFDNKGSSPSPDSEIYRGTGPFSEPEIQAVRDLFLQRSFKALISFHSYQQVIIYPWGYTTQPADKHDLLDEIAANMSNMIKAVNGRTYQCGDASKLMYLTNGDTTDWAYGTAGIPAYTIELPPDNYLIGGFMNAETDILPIFRENLPAMMYLSEWTVKNTPQAAPPQERKPADPRSDKKRIADR